MHNHKFQYKEEERRKRQNPEEILNSIGLKKNDTFIDLGCNDGFFTIPAAKIVGELGKVYAADIDTDAISRLQQKAKDQNIVNIETKVDKAENIIFNKGIADIIFLGTVLHDFENPIKVLQNSNLMLKNSGIIVDFDWRKDSSELGPPQDIRLSLEDVSKISEQSGLKIIEEKNISNLFYQITLSKSI
jgi:ubiquinone/menaquinone biosynthesis C-methylase UbiE